MSERPFDLLRRARELKVPPPPPKLTGTDKLVLLALVLRADPTGRSWPSHETLARDTWLSRRAVQLSIARLEQAGLVRVERRCIEGMRERDSNRYTVSIGVVNQNHQVVNHVHHLVNQDHQGGGEPRSLRVVNHVHQGGEPSAQEVITEVINGSDHLAPATRAPTKPTKAKGKKTPKHPPEVIAAKNQIVETFAERFEAKKGVKPKSIDAADHAAAFRLAKTYSTEEACSIIRKAFEDSFVVEKNATLRFIASKADTFRGVPVAKLNGKHMAQPSSGRAWKPGSAS